MSQEVSAVAELLNVLNLTPVDTDVFSGGNRDIGTPQIFGGQVVAQALQAAYHTVSNRQVHSLHGYFLRPGDIQQPVRYEVQRSMDGASFSNRRVVAIQNNKPILHCGISFQVPEEGLFHSTPMPLVPAPEALVDINDFITDAGLSAQHAERLAKMAPAIEFRSIDGLAIAHRKPLDSRAGVWFKLRAATTLSPIMSDVLLAYLSDYHLLATSLRPHGLTYADLRMASIDHALWWHGRVDINDWLLYSIDSPHASGGRGFSRGTIFNRAGELIASVAQEGLLRRRK